MVYSTVMSVSSQYILNRVEDTSMLINYYEWVYKAKHIVHVWLCFCNFGSNKIECSNEILAVF